jgi:carbon-monoxide dehydrogenase medium subunit
MEIAIVSVAVRMTLDEAKETCEEIRIALGAVAPTIMRAQKAEERLKGKSVTQTSIEEVARMASEECKPITDMRASAQYRKEMVRVATERAIRQAMSEVKNPGP